MEPIVMTYQPRRLVLVRRCPVCLSIGCRCPRSAEEWDRLIGKLELAVKTSRTAYRKIRIMILETYGEDAFEHVRGEVRKRLKGIP
jgi:hypothetical protein